MSSGKDVFQNWLIYGHSQREGWHLHVEGCYLARSTIFCLQDSAILSLFKINKKQTKSYQRIHRMAEFYRVSLICYPTNTEHHKLTPHDQLTVLFNKLLIFIFLHCKKFPFKVILIVFLLISILNSFNKKICTKIN